MDFLIIGVVSLLLFASVVMIVCGGAEPIGQWLRSWVARSESKYKEELGELFMSDWTPRLITYLTALTLVVFFFIALAISDSLILSLVLAALAVLAPGLLLQYMRPQRMERMEKFEAQLIDALELMANSVKSGQTLIQAIDTVSKHMLPPISQEFGLMVKEYDFGVPLDQVILNARQRLKSKNLTLATSALIVSREKGGNLPETLRKIADSIREIHRLEEKIKTSTAEGRKSARTMAFMPFVLGFMLYIMDPASFSLLFTDLLGNLILLIALVLIGVGFYWIKKIVDVPI
jgi:tight adherence protein B